MPNLPGVYTQVIDNSFVAPQTGRFTCGLVGPASRGPFNTAVSVPSLNAFVGAFGSTVTGSYLALAVNAIAAWADGISVVRVGRQYTPAIGQASGSLGSYNLFSSAATSVAANAYLQVTQIGKYSTFNAQVQSVSTGTVALVSSGAAAVALADNYTAAAVASSTTTAAASSAETLLQAPVYGAALAAVGAVTGTQSAWSFTVTGNASLLVAGNAIKITQTGSQTTREAIVASVSGSTVYLQTTANTATGQQAVALQDNYTAGTVYLQTGTYTSAVFMQAATAGTWANSVGTATSGLVVEVSPGSNQDTKKLLVYLNGQLVESFDNLVWSSPTSANYWLTVLTGDSYVAVRDQTLLSVEPPANTLAPWNTNNPTVNVSTMAGGADGSNVQDADIVGTLDANGNPSGLFVYSDPRNYSGLYLLAAPGFSNPAVYQQLMLVAGQLNARAVVDIPDMLTLAQAVNWTNGQGAYSYGSLPSNFRGSFYFNWFQTTDPTTQSLVWAPPSVGVLAAIARAYNQVQPWRAAAGTQWGTIPIALAVRYPRLRTSDLENASAPGNIVNPIMLYNGNAILIWGEVSSQRVASMLTSNAVVDLVNTLLKQMSAVSTRYVFDPNDPVLVSQLTLEYQGIIQGLITNRGITGNYNLNIIQGAAQINSRSLLVNLAVIPIPPVYRIFINVTVNQAGATLNAINGAGSITS